MRVSALLLVARSVPRALKVTSLITGVLIGLSGGLATAAAVKAVDVQNAYDRVTRATDGFDAAVVSDGIGQDLTVELRAVEGIKGAADVTSFEVAALTAGADPITLGPEPDDPCYTGAGDVTATVHTDGWRGRAPPMALSEGRFPLVDAREVVLPAITARRLDIEVGDRIVLAGDCAPEGLVPFDEPVVVRVAGIGTGALDGPEVGANFGLENLLISPRVVDEIVDQGAVPGAYSVVWLDDGVQPSDLRGLPEDSRVILDMVELRAAVRADLRSDATALQVSAVIVAMSALVILGPMLGRLVRAGNATAPVLRSLGMEHRHLVAVAVARGAAVALVAAVVAAGATAGFAARLPIGAARLFHGAVSFSPGVVRSLTGALAVGAMTVAITGAVAWVTVRRRHLAAAPKPTRRVRRIVSVFGLRPEWAAGAGFALVPGSLDDPTPVRSGLATAALAVAAVTGVVTFGSSLDHLRQTPRLYGVNWDVFALVENPEAIAAALEVDPEVEALARGTFFPPQFATLGEDGAEVWLMSFEAGPGRAKPTVISGRAPEADHEVMISHELSGTLGTDIGEVVSLHLPTAESLVARELEQSWDGPAERVTELEVVGIGVLPIGDGRVGIGSSLTLEGLKQAVGPTTSPELLDIVAGASPDVLTRLVRENVDPEVTGPDVAAMSADEVLSLLVEPIGAQIVVFDAGGPDNAQRKAIAASAGSLSAEDFAEPPTPERVINLDLSQAGRIPNAFSGLMAVIAIALVALLVASGGRQRSHDLAVLRVLGFGSGQVRRALAAQAVITVLAASLLVPVGIAIGRLAWVAYATSLGVVPEAWASPTEILIVIVSLLAVALAVAIVAARFQVRRSISTMLRPPE